MKNYQLKRANEIMERRNSLLKMREWLGNENKRISVIASGCSVNDTVDFSTDMIRVLLGMCIGETAKLDAEFKKL